MNPDDKVTVCLNIKTLSMTNDHYSKGMLHQVLVRVETVCIENERQKTTTKRSAVPTVRVTSPYCLLK